MAVRRDLYARVLRELEAARRAMKDLADLDVSKTWQDPDVVEPWQKALDAASHLDDMTGEVGIAGSMRVYDELVGMEVALSEVDLSSRTAHAHATAQVLEDTKARLIALMRSDLGLQRRGLAADLRSRRRA